MGILGNFEKIIDFYCLQFVILGIKFFLRLKSCVMDYRLLSCDHVQSCIFFWFQ